MSILRSLDEFHDIQNAPPSIRDQAVHAVLNVLFSELEGLFAAVVGPRLPFSLSLIDAPEPHLAICRSSLETTASVTVDTHNGYFVFKEFDRDTSVTLMTRSEERLIDQIVAHLAETDDGLTPHTTESAIDTLVGQTMADVERKLIMQTLRRCDGNPTHTAFMLGISLATLFDKLTNYFDAAGRAGSANAEDVSH
jgi:DNA-binding protein Fis